MWEREKSEKWRQEGFNSKSSGKRFPNSKSKFEISFLVSDWLTNQIVGIYEYEFGP